MMCVDIETGDVAQVDLQDEEAGVEDIFAQIEKKTNVSYERKALPTCIHAWRIQYKKVLDKCYHYN